jgi:hypothetical protein
MPSRPLSRRALLRGLGGIAVALPGLEIMGITNVAGRRPRAFAGTGTTPKRYIFCYAAHSVAMTANDYSSGTQVNDGAFFVRPKNAGRSYDLPSGIMPFADFGVQDDISVVSGLVIPWGNKSRGACPLGGVNADHSASIPQICGFRVPEPDFPERNDIYFVPGPSSDQIVANLIGNETRFRSIAYCPQTSAPYGGTAFPNRCISWNWPKGVTQGQSGYGNDVPDKIEYIEPIINPQLAFQSLFTGFMDPNADPVAVKKAQAQLQRRKSVLDLVRESTASLLPRLGRIDRDRMARHFDEIRALENKLTAFGATGTSSSCTQPPEPGSYENDDDIDKRAELLTDLLCMGLTCDLTRVATMAWVYIHSTVGGKALGSFDTDIHSIGHFYSIDQVAEVSKVIQWQMKHFARLVRKLKDTPDVDGSSVLDNSAIVQIFDAGYGFPLEQQRSGPSPETRADPMGYTVHSSDNMCVLVAGRAGGLNPGKHIVAQDQHPVRVVNSAMHAVGVQQDLGEVSGDIPELFTV